MATYVCPPVCPPRALPVEPGSASRVWRAAQRAIADPARRTRKPAALRRLARLAPDERQPVATCDLSNAVVIATNAALHRLGPPKRSGDWSR